MVTERRPTIPGNRYILHNPLGRGAIGTVYRATDRLHDTIVALKQITISPKKLQFASRVDDASDKALRLSLANEFQTLASLRHPHIISVLDYGFDEHRQPYFTMDYMENGRNIVEASRGKSTAEKINYLAQMLEALTYLHRRGILHRDLKPDNVLVVDGDVRVLDFGLSASREAAQGRAGTMAYMAPEVLRTGGAAEASDLYAVGIIAYQLIAGQTPFASADIMGIISRPPDVTSLSGEPALAHVVEKLLQKDPAERYPSAQAAIAAFDKALGRPQKPEDTSIRESFLQAARFVGRDAELKQLIVALDRARAGKGSAWLVGGESGVGKSRLLDELRIRALVKGTTVLRGQAVEDGGLPYQLWRDAMRRLALSTDLNELEASVLKEIVPDAGALLGYAVPDAPEVDTQLRQQRLVLTIAGVFRKAARQQPVVLLVEDLQWTEESLEPLKHLSRICGTLPLLIVGDYRDDERPELPNGLPGMQGLPLQRLLMEHIAELSASMLGEAGRRPQVVELLQRETEGNVFFLVETVRALAEESGRLSKVGRVALPDTIFAGGVRQIIQRRLRRVPEDDYPLLKLAAVAGRALDLDLLRALASGINLDDWLITGANVAVLEVRERHWRFAHDKLRQALLADLPYDERQALHRQVAGTLETVYAADGSTGLTAGLAPHYGALTYHYGQAEDVAQERHYAKLAGEQAAARFANDEAIRFFSRALDLTPEDDAAGRYALLSAREKVYDVAGAREVQAGDLAALSTLAEQLDAAKQTAVALRQANYTDLTGDYDGAIAAARQAVALALAGVGGADGAALAARGEVAWGKALMRQGAYEGAQARLEGALAVLERAGATQEAAFARWVLGVVFWYRGQYEAARAMYQAALAGYRAVGDRQGEGQTLSRLGLTARDQGDLAGAQTFLRQALAIAQEIGDRQGEGNALNNLGLAARSLGDLAGAQACYRQTLDIAQEIGDRQGEGNTLNNLARVVYAQGDLAGAQTLLRQTLAIRREIGDRQGEGAILHNLGMVARTLGDPAGAQAFLRQALPIRREIGDRRGEGLTLHDLGAVACDLGDPSTGSGQALAEARDFYRQALAILQEIGHRPAEGHTLNRLGLVAYALGDLTAAQDFYRQALAIRQALGQPQFQVEDEAGMARVALAQGDLPQARAYLAAVLAYLETNPTLDGTQYPFRVFLTCYQVLAAAQHPQAAHILTNAHTLLQERAAKIPDEETRRVFLENVPSHRELVAAWKEHQKQGK